MKEFDWRTWVLPVLTLIVGWCANLITGWFNRDGARMNSDVLRLQHQQTAEEKFRDDLIARIDRMQTLFDAQGEKLNARAVEIAELKGKVQVLEHSEGFLKIENQRLTTENAALKAKNTELNDEAELQAQRIAELMGQLRVYQVSPGTPNAAPPVAVIPGECP